MRSIASTAGPWTARSNGSIGGEGNAIASHGKCSGERSNVACSIRRESWLGLNARCTLEVAPCAKRVQPRNRMRENRTSGSVAGVPGNRHPYAGGVNSARCFYYWKICGFCHWQKSCGENGIDYGAGVEDTKTFSELSLLNPSP